MTVQTMPAAGHVLVDWRPEDESFWSSRGEAIARRNLWISIPALLLAFAVWMVWSAVVVNLPRVGFAYSADQLFWLAALPGLSGATLRIFYSFMVPIFGGRRWTAISTATLLIPAAGIGFAVQNPAHPLLAVPAAGAALRLRRWQFRLLDGQHQLFLSQGEEGAGAGPQRRARQSRRQRGPAGGPAGDQRRHLRRSRRRGAGADRTGAVSGCRTPASSGCRSSRSQRSPPGSA